MRDYNVECQFSGDPRWYEYVTRLPMSEAVPYARETQSRNTGRAWRVIHRTSKDVVWESPMMEHPL